MGKEVLRRGVDERPPRHFPPPGRPHPARLHQHVERALGNLHAAYRLHRAHPVVHLPHAALTNKVEKTSFWRSTTLPSRASSSVATKLDASADLRNSASCVSGRKDSSAVHSTRVPSMRSSRWIASS